VSVSPVLSLRNAVLAIVRAAPEAAICTGRIHDAVPVTGATQSLPHVSCGPAGLTRSENGARGVPVLRLRLYVASSRLDRDQAWTLAHALADRLEGAEPPLGGGFHLIDCLRVVQMGDVIDRIAPTEVFLDIVTTAQAD
jgi:hypothetical protein